MNRLLYLLLLGALFWSSCNVINPEEEIPAYIYVEPFEFTAGPDQGTNSSKITEVWLFVDGDYLGAYPLPSMIPLLEKGEKLVSLRPGIKENGIASQPEMYPAYAPFEVTLNLQANKIDTLRPETTYKSDLIFEFIEGFENDNHVFRDISEEDEPFFSITTDDPFEGDRCGLIKLDTSNFIVGASTLARFPNPVQNAFQRAYLEINFKSDVPVFWGLIGHESNPTLPPKQLFNAGSGVSEEWNKIYINLTPLALNTDYVEFQVAFAAFIPTDETGLTLSKETGEVRIDNIKFIHF